MIKFFRKIRYDLMDKNKTVKYLKYAIGEIVLVVFGILIALSINNWNENRKERLQEQELLIQLQSEFKSNLKQLDEKIALRDTMISASLKLINCIDYPHKCNDEDIIKYTSTTTYAPTFDPIINDIISSGRVQILENTDLKQKLSLWTSEIIQVTEEEQTWAYYRTNDYTPFLRESGVLRGISSEFWRSNNTSIIQLDGKSISDFEIGSSREEIDFKSLLGNQKFEGFVIQCATYSNWANIQSISLRKRIVEILEIISQELKHNK